MCDLLKNLDKRLYGETVNTQTSLAGSVATRDSVMIEGYKSRFRYTCKYVSILGGKTGEINSMPSQPGKMIICTSLPRRVDPRVMGAGISGGYLVHACIAGDLM